MPFNFEASWALDLKRPKYALCICEDVIVQVPALACLVAGGILTVVRTDIHELPLFPVIQRYLSP